MEVPEIVLTADSDPIQVERMFKPARGKRQKPDLVNGVEMLTRGEDINTLAVIGEVGPLVTQGRSPNGNGPFGGGGRVSAGVPVVVTGSESEVHVRVDGSVDGIIQSQRLATTQRHLCDGSLVPCLSSGSVFSLGCSELSGSLFNSPHNTANDISHGTTSVGTQDLDGNEVDSLGNTVLAGTNGTGAVGPVTVPVVVDVILWDGLSPGGTTLELDVVHVDTSIDDVDVDALATGRIVFIASECSDI